MIMDIKWLTLQLYDRLQQRKWLPIEVSPKPALFLKEVVIGYGPDKKVIDLVGVALDATHSPVIIGVEVKASRANLMADDKIHSYLPFCHYFYVCVPNDVVKKARAKVSTLDNVGVVFAIGDGLKVDGESPCVRREISLERRNIVLTEILRRGLGDMSETWRVVMSELTMGNE